MGTIRDAIKARLDRRETAHLVKLLGGRSERGLSRRKVYDFLDYGKSINSDALQVIFDLLDLEIVVKQEVARREEADALRRSRRTRREDIYYRQKEEALKRKLAVQVLVDRAMESHKAEGWKLSAVAGEDFWAWNARRRCLYWAQFADRTS